MTKNINEVKTIQLGKVAVSAVGVISYHKPENTGIVFEYVIKDDEFEEGGYIDEMVLTVNIPVALDKDVVLVKDYSEGEILGFKDMLVKLDLIEDEVINRVPSGMVLLPMYKLSELGKKLLAHIKNTQELVPIDKLSNFQ